MIGYLSVAIFLFIITLIIEVLFREHLFHSFKERFIWVGFALFAGTLWDSYAIPNQHWIFPGKGLTGIYFGPIPLEEFVWFLVVPYFWITVYETVHIILDKKRSLKWKK